jgi:hypothetical protein
MNYIDMSNTAIVYNTLNNIVAVENVATGCNVLSPINMNVIIGQYSDVNAGHNNVIIGAHNTITGNNNIVIGTNNTITGNNNVVFGNNLVINDDVNYVVIGNDVIRDIDSNISRNIMFDKELVYKLMLFSSLDELPYDIQRVIIKTAHDIRLTRGDAMAYVVSIMRNAMNGINGI